MIAAGMANVAMVANQAKIPTICGESGMVKAGGFATYGINYYELGKTRYIFVANKKYINISDNVLRVNDLSKYPIILQEYPSN